MNTATRSQLSLIARSYLPVLAYLVVAVGVLMGATAVRPADPASWLTHLALCALALWSWYRFNPDASWPRRVIFGAIVVLLGAQAVVATLFAVAMADF
jgi:hypothetical protein